MRRLYIRIYVAMLACLVVFALCVGLIWRTMIDANGIWPAAAEMAGRFAQNLLPPPSAPPHEQQAALERIGAGMPIDISLFGPDHAPVAGIGAPLPPPPPDAHGGMHPPMHAGGPGWTAHLPDGRWLVVRHAGLDHPPRAGLGLTVIAALVLLFLAVAIAVHPVARRLTRRLERLQQGVETLGSGDLSARVHIRGRDEVAQLAASFNRAAARIEELVGAHKMLLANASHELRTPLTRIRMGVELMKDDPSPQRHADLERDIAEIDALIEGILLSSRLDALGAAGTKEDSDLLAIAAEECARYDGCSVGGESVIVQADPGLLRHLLRNLVENALRHGRPPVDVTVGRENGIAVLRVSDHGDGIADSERETVFEPFRRARGAAKGGTGLGLSLVRKIARLHGGDARVEEPGPGGLTVLVTFGSEGAADQQRRA
ncbi:MAG TPA: HAMP domain-containing sensor histidine kinase [Burkholderiales bacterium]|nr:HAMP domain-containing sensor histidine kinase [Burkholderiales bacterium]